MTHLLLAGLLFAFQERTEAPRKEAVPETAALKKAEMEIKDLLKTEYKATDPAERRSLARKLLDAGSRGDQDPPTRYVVLREAAEIAAQSEDLGTAFTAVDRLGAQFEVDLFGLKADALTTARKAGRRSDAMLKVATAGLRLAREARGADRVEQALRALKEAEAAAKAARDPVASKMIMEESRLLAAAKKDLAEVEEAKAKLAAAPDDPKANLTLGRWLAFEKGAFKEGLPHLAKASDKKLSDAAKLDIEGSDAFRIGEAWMRLSGTVPRGILLTRACDWLKKAWHAADPPARERLRPRLLGILSSPKGAKAQPDLAPAGWNIMGGQSKTAWDPTLSWTGERSVRLMSAKASGPTAWTGLHTARMPAAAGTEYRISVRVLTEKDQGASGTANGVWLLFYGADPKPIKEVSFMFTPDLPVWSLVEGTVEAPPGTERIEISFHHDAPAGSFWIDAVSLLANGEELLASGDFEAK